MNDMYTGWYDPSKRPLNQRLNDALDLFELRRGYRPAVVLVNETQRAEVTAPSVAADTFYLAHERVSVETAPSQTMLWEVR